MITNINPMNSINFQARIKIKKAGLENLIKDVGDSSSIGARATGSTVSGAAEVTTFPVNILSNGDKLSAVRYNADALAQETNAILTRDLKTLESDKTLKAESKEIAKSSAQTSAASSLVGTGSGSYYSAGASALDQSVHYPNSLYAQSSYEGLENMSTPESVQIMENAERWAYDSLYDPHAAGNESASSASTMVSAAGVGSHGAGSSFLRENAEKLGKTKKIPS